MKSKEYMVDEEGRIRFVSYIAFAQKHNCDQLKRETGYRFKSHSEDGKVSVFTDFRPQGKAFPLKEAVDPVTGKRIS